MSVGLSAILKHRRFSIGNRPKLVMGKGAVHKVRHARGGRGPRRCDSLWQREGGKEHV